MADKPDVERKTATLDLTGAFVKSLCAKLDKAESQRDELVAKILEVAQLHDDDAEGGIVFMPDEEEWGNIVGIARKVAQP